MEPAEGVGPDLNRKRGIASKRKQEKAEEWRVFSFLKLKRRSRRTGDGGGTLSGMWHSTEVFASLVFKEKSPRKELAIEPC